MARALDNNYTIAPQDLGMVCSVLAQTGCCGRSFLATAAALLGTVCLSGLAQVFVSLPGTCLSPKGATRPLKLYRFAGDAVGANEGRAKALQHTALAVKDRCRWMNRGTLYNRSWIASHFSYKEGTDQL